MGQLIQVPVLVTNFKPRKDRSWRIEFETRELSGDEVKLLAESYQGEGYLVFKPNASDIALEDIPEGEADAGVKTPSHRYRSKLYVYWKQHGGVEAMGSFDNFYRAHYDKLGEVLESKLEPQED